MWGKSDLIGLVGLTTVARRIARHRGRRIVQSAAAVVIALLVTSAASFAQTKFRGIYIDMPRSEFDALPLREKDLSATFDGDTAHLRRYNRLLAEVVFDGDKRTKSIKFGREFFGAQDLFFSEFRRELARAYGLNFNCSTQSIPISGVRPFYHFEKCTALAHTGERINLDELGSIELDGVEVSVERSTTRVGRFFSRRLSIMRAPAE
jgi:hypothetical protein